MKDDTKIVNIPCSIIDSVIVDDVRKVMNMNALEADKFAEELLIKAKLGTATLKELLLIKQIAEILKYLLGIEDHNTKDLLQ